MRHRIAILFADTFIVGERLAHGSLWPVLSLTIFDHALNRTLACSPLWSFVFQSWWAYWSACGNPRKKRA